MAITRYATAHWQGDLKSGKGTLATPASGLLADTPYGFNSRFGDAKGTNPEELIAAAHAACFAMAFSAQLGGAGLKPERVDAKATVTLEKVGDAWEVTESHLEMRARIPGADQAAFEKAAKAAEEGCPISKLLKAKITLDAKLEG